MKEQEAITHFHGTTHLNCAQSILKTFQTEAGVTEDAIREAGKLGGGKAPGGLCGALYSALVLLDDDRNEFKREFINRAGSSHCREIRHKRQLSCSGCVAHAASLLEQQLNNKPHRGPAANYAQDMATI